jgi:hypothetical protein
MITRLEYIYEKRKKEKKTEKKTGEGEIMQYDK